MPQTLLLADDSVTIQRVIELTFADEDIRVVAVSDGDQAIAALDSDVPDIVLVDVEMPNRNGYEVAEHIRDTPRLAHIRVLLLTGASEPIDRERAAAVACDGVLAKPFEPQQVIATVRELLAAPKRGAVEFHAPIETPRHVVIADGVESPADRAASVDEYLMRLDEALSGLSEGQASPQAQGPRPPNRQPQAPPLPPSSPGSLPSLDAAFAALLAAERTGSADPVSWPPPAAAPADSLVEEVTARVLSRLSTTLVPSTVTDVVSKVAERLVREEIDRIKASLDSQD